MEAIFSAVEVLGKVRVLGGFAEDGRTRGGVAATFWAQAAQVVALIPQVIGAAHIAVTNDADIALLGAHGGGPGMIAISGTGSIVLGRNLAGARQRVGGWGWLLADEGSAFAIGRNGLRAALAAADRAGPATRMHADFLAHFGMADFGSLKRHVYAPAFGAAEFAP